MVAAVVMILLPVAMHKDTPAWSLSGRCNTDGKNGDLSRASDTPLFHYPTTSTTPWAARNIRKEIEALVGWLVGCWRLVIEVMMAGCCCNNIHNCKTTDRALAHTKETHFPSHASTHTHIETHGAQNNGTACKGYARRTHLHLHCSCC